MFKRIQRLGSVPTKYQVAVVLKDLRMDVNVTADMGVLVTRGPHRCQSEVVSGTGLWVWSLENQKKRPIMLNCTLYFDKDKQVFQSKICKITVKQIQGSNSKTVGEIVVDLANYATGKMETWEMSTPLDKCKGAVATLNYTIHSRPLPAGAPGTMEDTMSTLEGMDQSYIDPDSIADFGQYAAQEMDEEPPARDRGKAFSIDSKANVATAGIAAVGAAAAATSTPAKSSPVPEKTSGRVPNAKNLSDSDSDSDLEDPDVALGGFGKAKTAAAAAAAGAVKTPSKGKSAFDMEDSEEEEEVMGFGRKPKAAVSEEKSEAPIPKGSRVAASVAATAPVETQTQDVKSTTTTFPQTPTKTTNATTVPTMHQTLVGSISSPPTTATATPAVIPPFATPEKSPASSTTAAAAASSSPAPSTATTAKSPASSASPASAAVASVPETPPRSSASAAQTPSTTVFTTTSSSYVPSLAPTLSATLPTPSSPVACKSCAQTKQEVQSRISNLQQHIEELEKRLGAAEAARINERLRAEAAEEALNSHDKETKSVIDDVSGKYELREKEMRYRAETAEEKLRTLDETYVTNIEHLQKSYEDQKQRFKDALEVELTLLKKEVATLRESSRQFEQITDLKIKKPEQKLMAELAFYHGQLLEHEDLILQVKESYREGNRLLMDNVEQLEMVVADLRKQQVNQSVILREQDRKMRDYEATIKAERAAKQTLAEHINTLELQFSAQAEQLLAANSELDEVKAENARLKKFIQRMGY